MQSAYLATRWVACRALEESLQDGVLVHPTPHLVGACLHHLLDEPVTDLWREGTGGYTEAWGGTGRGRVCQGGQ